MAVWIAAAWSNSFAYDGLMRKRIQQEFAWNGAGWTETNEVQYVYDGNLVLQERDKNNEPLTTYTRSVDLSETLQGAGGIGGLLARSDNQKIVPAMLTPANPNPQNVMTSYYFSDDQGNVTALVSPAGMLLAQYEYDPFGNLISKSGLLADLNKYRFSSKEWDDNAGLYYYGYRFYDPNLQRWVNRDPIQEMGGINLYEFAENSAINAMDFFGLSSADVARIISLSQAYTSLMTKNGQRLNNGDINNVVSTFQRAVRGKHPYKGCGEQADALAKFLNGAGTDDPWEFYRVDGHSGPIPHQWLVAVPGNPNDPQLYLDPWKGQFNASGAAKHGDSIWDSTFGTVPGSRNGIVPNQ